jgi:hypothetical protein
MPVFLHGKPLRLPPRRWAGEDFQLAASIIVEPFDAPLPRHRSIFENLGWFRHCQPPHLSN